MVREQLSRLGDTPFELRELHCDLAGEPMVPKSVLNDLRRQATAELIRQREHAHEIARPHALDELRRFSHLPLGEGRVGAKTEGLTSVDPRPHPNLPPEGERIGSESIASLHVLVRTLDQLTAAIEFGPTSIYCDFEDV